MIESVKDWYRALSQREQILISILVILLALTVAFYGILQPFAGALESAERDYVEAIERQARIKSKIAALQGDGAPEAQILNGSLDSFVSQSAGEAGFAIGTIDPQNDGSVNVTIESAKPVALFGWLAQLEQTGVVPASLTVSSAENGTVTANLRLSKMAR